MRPSLPSPPPKADAAPTTQPHAQSVVVAPPARQAASSPTVQAIAATVPAVTASAAVVPADTTTTPVTARKGAKVQVAARPTAATSTKPKAAAPPVNAAHKLSTPLPWTRIGEIAAVLVLLAAGNFVWLNISPLEIHAAAARTTATGASAPHDMLRSEGKLADSAVPIIHSEYVDSLVLTRRTCTLQCTAYELHVMTNGTVQYVQLVAFGEPRVVGSALTAPKQEGIGKVLAQTPFESAAAAPTGHTLCNASDGDSHNHVRIVISRGNA